MRTNDDAVMVIERELRARGVNPADVAARMAARSIRDLATTAHHHPCVVYDLAEALGVSAEALVRVLTGERESRGQAADAA